jgi:hypothetical protein
MKNEFSSWWIREGEDNTDEKEEAHVVLTIDQMLSAGFNFFACYAFYRYQFGMETERLMTVAMKYNDIFPWLFDFLQSEIWQVEQELIEEGNEWMLTERNVYDY